MVFYIIHNRPIIPEEITISVNRKLPGKLLRLEKHLILQTRKFLT